MIFFWFVLLEICGGVFAHFTTSNQYMDFILQKNIKYAGIGKNIDPAVLTNLSTECKIPVESGYVDVKINFYDVKMIGLFKGQRAGDCSLIHRDAYGNVTFNCSLVYQDVKVILKGEMISGISSKDIIMMEAIFTPSAFIDVTSTFQIPNYPTLRIFELKQVGSVSIKFIRPFNNELENFVKDNLVNAISVQFSNVFYFNYQTAMLTAISFTPMPLC